MANLFLGGWEVLNNKRVSEEEERFTDSPRWQHTSLHAFDQRQ